jgi:hypothetical protein
VCAQKLTSRGGSGGGFFNFAGFLLMTPPGTRVAQVRQEPKGAGTASQNRPRPDLDRPKRFHSPALLALPHTSTSNSRISEAPVNSLLKIDLTSSSETNLAKSVIVFFNKGDPPCPFVRKVNGRPIAGF